MVLNLNCVVNNEPFPSYSLCELGFPLSFSALPVTYTRTPQNAIVLSGLQCEVPQRSRKGSVLPLGFSHSTGSKSENRVPNMPSCVDAKNLRIFVPKYTEGGLKQVVSRDLRNRAARPNLGSKAISNERRSTCRRLRDRSRCPRCQDSPGRCNHWKVSTVCFPCLPCCIPPFLRYRHRPGNALGESLILPSFQI